MKKQKYCKNGLKFKKNKKMISLFSVGFGLMGKVLGWMIIYSLWQISLIVLVLVLVLRMVFCKQVNVCYVLLLMGLVVVVCWLGMIFQFNWVYYGYVFVVE